MADNEVDLGEEFEESYGADETLESDGAWMPVTGKPGWRIKLRSQWSPIWRNFTTKQQRRHIKLFQAKKDVPAEEFDKDRIEQLAKVGVTEWEGFNNLPCTPANVAAVMRRYGPFREECLTFAADRSNHRREQVNAMGEASPPLSPQA